MQPSQLTCEYFTAPVGMDTLRPRLAWKLSLEHRGIRQCAYQVQAAANEADLHAEKQLLWDSGTVSSAQSTQVEYGGAALISRLVVFWRVRFWDERGQVSDWSEPSSWEMGLLENADWQANWVGSPLAGGKHSNLPAPYLRRDFAASQGIRKGRLYVSALGLFECWINGQRVGEDYFMPGWTDFNKRVRYAVYDVTAMLHSGENALGAILGDGWYCGYLSSNPRQQYGEQPKLMYQLELEMEDGSRQTVVSDQSWRWAYGPIVEADLIYGESYDARREIPGWNLPGFDVTSWQPVALFDTLHPKLEAYSGPKVRRMEELAPIAAPVKHKGWENTRWIFDLGQNMVGWARIRVNGKAGTTVRIRFAEMLNPDGTLYTTNLRSARATDYYTLKGEGEEVFEPHFTFHGFRYVELTDLPEEMSPDVDTVRGMVFYSAMPKSGSFECSDPLLNQLQHNIQWGQRGNFLDVPTDCPQRDERLGWTGDAQVFIRTAAFNRQVAGFFTKWVQDLEDAQSEYGQIPSVAPNFWQESYDGGPAWADAFVICPWTVYLCYEDKRILAQHYPAMQRYVNHLKEMSVNFIRCHPDSKYQHKDWDGFGDWLSINAETPKDLIGTAFMAYCARLMARIAKALDKPKDAAEWTKLFEDTRQAFQRRFVSADGLVVGQSQTCYVLALQFDLLPEALRPAAVRELVRDIQRRDMHLSTGFVGAPYLMHVLTRFGQDDTAFALLHQTSWPSWLYSVTKGATTIWERWDGWTEEKGFQDPGMNSFNHYAYGSIGDWMYDELAGIGLDADEPGYRHILLHPHLGGGLTRARAAYESPYGQVVSEWEQQKDAFSWKVVVPPNTRATLTFPVGASARIVVDNLPIEQVGEVTRASEKSEQLIYEIPSGVYHFVIQE